MPNTPLNPDAIHAVMVKLLPAYVGIGPNAGRFSEAVTRNAREHIENVVSAYLEVAQPVLTTQEELDSMPHETVIRDSQDFVFEGIVQRGMDLEWWCTTDFLNELNELNETKVILPARVLFIPEVKP